MKRFEKGCHNCAWYDPEATNEGNTYIYGKCAHSYFGNKKATYYKGWLTLPAENSSCIPWNSTMWTPKYIKKWKDRI